MMPTTTLPQDDDPARLAPLLVDALRIMRTLRAEYRACSELLRLALEMLAERDREIDRLRDRYHRVLDERRAERQRAA